MVSEADRQGAVALEPPGAGLTPEAAAHAPCGVHINDVVKVLDCAEKILMQAPFFK